MIHNLIRVIDSEKTEQVRPFEGVDALSTLLNDEFPREGECMKLELYTKDGETEVFYLAPVNDEATIIVRGTNFQYEPDPDEWAEKVFEYVDRDEVNSYRVYKDYSFTMIVERV